jgi:hypothetical protein
VAAFLPTYGGNILTGNVINGNVITTTSLSATASVLTPGVQIGNQGISAAGNITANRFIGNGALLTNIVASYGNANVANYLPTFTGTLAGGGISVVGTANAGAGFITIATVSAVGNIITNSFFVGNGRQLTGIVSTYGDSNVATYLSGGTVVNINAGNVSASGNVVANDVRTATVSASGLVSLATGISSQGNIVTNNTLIANTVRITGNLSKSQQTIASPGSTGISGQIAWDGTYIYVCVSTNTWRRVPLLTW